jgi:hypothetical protein
VPTKLGLLGKIFFSLSIVAPGLAGCIEAELTCAGGATVIVDGELVCATDTGGGTGGGIGGGIGGGTGGGIGGSTAYFTTTGCGPQLPRSECDAATGAPCAGDCWPWVGDISYCRVGCATDSECDTVDPGSRCVHWAAQDVDGGTIQYACSTPCNPFEASTCPAGQTCSIFADPTRGDLWFTECRPLGVAAEGARCVPFEPSCAAGLACQYLSAGIFSGEEQGYRCVRHCRPGSEDCPENYECTGGTARGLLCDGTIQAAFCQSSPL